MKKLILLFVGLTSLAARPVSNGYQVGDTVADFKLKNVDGKMVSLADYTDAKGFIVILIFAVSTPVPSDFTRTFTYGSITRLTVTRTFMRIPRGRTCGNCGRRSFYRKPGGRETPTPVNGER